MHGHTHTHTHTHKFADSLHMVCAPSANTAALKHAHMYALTHCTSHTCTQEQGGVCPLANTAATHARKNKEVFAHSPTQPPHMHARTRRCLSTYRHCCFGMLPLVRDGGSPSKCHPHQGLWAHLQCVCVCLCMCVCARACVFACVCEFEHVCVFNHSRNCPSHNSCCC